LSEKIQRKSIRIASLEGHQNIATNDYGFSDVAAFENRQSVTAAKFIIHSSLFILLLG
jgi:hypothetical protein